MCLDVPDEDCGCSDKCCRCANDETCGEWLCDWGYCPGSLDDEYGCPPPYICQLNDCNPYRTECAEETQCCRLVADNETCCKECIDCLGEEWVDLTTAHARATQVCRCCETTTLPVNRQVEVDTLLPYLLEIWNLSSHPREGFYNILRPYPLPAFEEEDAESREPLQYQFCNCVNEESEGSSCNFCNNIDGVGDCPPCWADPQTADFYFRYLGGVQLTKQRVTRSVLPYYNIALEEAIRELLGLD